MATGASEYMGYFHEKDCLWCQCRSTSVLSTPPTAHQLHFSLSLFHLVPDPCVVFFESLFFFATPIK